MLYFPLVDDKKIIQVLNIIKSQNNIKITNNINNEQYHQNDYPDLIESEQLLTNELHMT